MEAAENHPTRVLSHAPVLIKDAYRRAILLATAFFLVLSVWWLISLAAPAALAAGSELIATVSDGDRIARPETVAPEMANWPIRPIPLEWRWSRKGVDVDAMFRKSQRGR
jgi:hypothetical protein